MVTVCVHMCMYNIHTTIWFFCVYSYPSSCSTWHGVGPSYGSSEGRHVSYVLESRLCRGILLVSNCPNFDGWVSDEHLDKASAWRASTSTEVFLRKASTAERSTPQTLLVSQVDGKKPWPSFVSTAWNSARTLSVAGLQFGADSTALASHPALQLCH